LRLSLVDHEASIEDLYWARTLQIQLDSQSRRESVRIENYLFALLSQYFSHLHRYYEKLDSRNNQAFLILSQKWANYFSSITDSRQTMRFQGQISKWAETAFLKFIEKDLMPSNRADSLVKSFARRAGVSHHLQQLLEMFSVTSNHEVSRSYLARADWNLKRAINLYFSETSPTTTNGAGKSQ
jgi:hypothetical protein